MLSFFFQKILQLPISFMPAIVFQFISIIYIDLVKSVENVEGKVLSIMSVKSSSQKIFWPGSILVLLAD